MRTSDLGGRHRDGGAVPGARAGAGTRGFRGRGGLCDSHAASDVHEVLRRVPRHEPAEGGTQHRTPDRPDVVRPPSASRPTRGKTSPRCSKRGRCRRRTMRRCFRVDAERAAAAAWIRTSLRDYEAAHAGEPGRVTVRRLTSAEYAYAIRDLTGVDIKIGVDASSDAVGGEGFANFGDVQFVQDAIVERYLEASKQVADHAVIGSGPLDFYTDHRQDRPRAVGAQPDRTALRVARIPRGVGRRRTPVRLRSLREGVLRRLALPSSRGAGRAGRDTSRPRGEGGHHRDASPSTSGRRSIGRCRLSEPRDDRAVATVSRPRLRTSRRPSPGPATECDALVKALVAWPSWLFARGDLAAGGAGDESPLVFDDTTLGGRADAHLHLRVEPPVRPRRPVARAGAMDGASRGRRASPRPEQDTGGHLAEPARGPAHGPAARPEENQRP